jgi:hypothetical protein
MPLRRSLIAAGTVLFLAGCAPSIQPGGDVACTMDAKVCPDGSAVGRMPPDCQFAACPGESSSSSANGALSLSDGTITLMHSGTPFGLAVTPEQILVTSSIPPCEDGFDYCFYYDGGAYEGTNFDSAGLGIRKRTDLSGETQCLADAPNGWTQKSPEMYSDADYATSLFTPLGDGAMGHFTHDSVYRLHVADTCYELRTRIGQSQFANYPEGTIREFTTNDEAQLQGDIGALLGRITLASNGEHVTFP